MNIFEYASRNKLRFSTGKGELTTEQLWSLPLKSTTGKLDLDTVAVGLAILLRDSVGLSFVDMSPDPVRKDTEIKMDIVKHIICTKKDENAQKVNNQQRKAEKQRILEVMESKHLATYQTMSFEELQSKLDSLENV